MHVGEESEREDSSGQNTALTFPLDALSGSVDLATAAALPSNTATAYVILSEVARLGQGETVLIHAAAGGVGSALGQVARSLGAGSVIGTVGSVEKIDYTKSLDYDHVLLRQGFTEQVWETTGRKGIDVVVDPVGGSVRTESLELLRPFGRLVVMGNASNAEDVAVSTTHLWLMNKAVPGFNLAAYSATFPEKANRAGRAALKLITRGEVRVAVTDVLPLEQASEAHRRIEQGATALVLCLHWTAAAGGP